MDLARAEGLMAALDRAELEAVAASVAFARQMRLTPAARLLSRLGNGWLYPIASALLLAASADRAVRCVLAAGVSIGIAHVVYPPIKRVLARTRPCDLDTFLADVCRPLDRYSCPSGHAMTVAAFGVPIILLAPAAAAPVVIACWFLVSWSRIALGHHYWSDIVIGSLIGGAIGTAGAILIV